MTGQAVGEAFRPPATDELPPWLPKRRPNRLDLDVYREPGQFFVTIATAKSTRWFANYNITSHCEGELRAACDRHGFAVIAYSFMPDHLHLLVDSARAGADLLKLMHDFKQRTAWWLRNRYLAGGLKASPTDSLPDAALWQRSYYDHVLRQDEDAEAIVQYILQNPVAAGLVDDAAEYAHSWCAYDWPATGRAVLRYT